MKPRSRYIAHSSSLTQERSSERARASARRSRPGSYGITGASWRRARWRDHISSMRGRSSSDRRATATSAVATSARSISVSPAPAAALAAAGRAREEDHAVRVAGDVLKRLDHVRLPASRGVQRGHRGPQSFVQLPAEFLDETLLVLGQLDVALGYQHLAVTGLHPEKAHVRIMSRPG